MAFLLVIVLSLVVVVVPDAAAPVLDAGFSLSSGEQESVYRVLEAINSDVNWRFLFPDDLCSSGPHGVVCDYLENGRPHVTELSFGYVSDYSSNPPCTSNSSFTPRIASFPFLRKLLFYRCFTGKKVALPGYFWNLNGSSLEELYFLENPSLVGKINVRIGNLSRLRRFVLSGTRVTGNIPDSIGNLPDLQQLVMARNWLSGEIPTSIGMLKNLQILDLSNNRLEGFLPEEVGNLLNLLKLDLGFNDIGGKIPNRLMGLQRLEFLDLSFNHLANSGIPLFLGEMPTLKEVYLSGNRLGGKIPEIWEKLGGIIGLGFSNLGLVGNIPKSMGIYLKNVCYLGLDNNMLEGAVPEEFGFLESVKEIALQNNRLTGRIPFSGDLSVMVKLAGNHDLCIDASKSGGVAFEGFKNCRKAAIPHAVYLSQASFSEPSMLIIFFLCLILFWAF